MNLKYPVMLVTRVGMLYDNNTKRFSTQMQGIDADEFFHTKMEFARVYQNEPTAFYNFFFEKKLYDEILFSVVLKLFLFVKNA